MVIKNYRLIILALSFGAIFASLVSCGKQDTSSPDSPLKSPDTVDRISWLDEPIDDVEMIRRQRHFFQLIAPYLNLTEDSLYTLDLSQEKATALGIDSTLLAVTKNSLLETNKLLKERRQAGESPVVYDLRNQATLRMADSLSLESEKLHLRLRASNPYKPQKLIGTIHTTGQEEARTGLVWAPYDVCAVNFACRSYAAPFPMFKCATESSGIWWHAAKFGVGYQATLQVGLYVSNDYVTLSFQTSDSNGGETTYSGILNTDEGLDD